MARDPRDPVVVFSMGKTGSSALVRGLRAVTDDPVYKVHLLDPARVREAEERYRRTDPDARPRHILHASHLLRRLPTPEHPWRVITVAREPIARAASDFFQSGERRGWLNDPGAATEQFERFAVRESVPRTLGWFDDELLPALGVDVYAAAFDPAVGHATLEGPSVRVLVLRQEGLADAGEAIGAFLGTPPASMPAENVGAAKPYSDLYATVLGSACFDDAVLEAAYSSRYARHFYSDDERRGFTERWRRGGVDDTGRA